MTRKKLLAMLDQYKWRKKEISNYFLPKTRQERMVAKQKFAAQYGRKDVAYKQTAATLQELRTTIMDSSGTDTLEDVGRTKQLMEEQQITMSERKKAVDQQKDRSMELTRKDIRGARDTTLKDMMRIDDGKA